MPAPTRAQQAHHDAAELIVFADGMEAVGYADYARRARVVARDVIWLVGELEAERSAYATLKARYDVCLQILANQAADAEADDVPF